MNIKEEEPEANKATVIRKINSLLLAFRRDTEKCFVFCLSVSIHPIQIYIYKNTAASFKIILFIYEFYFYLSITIYLFYF